MIRGFLTCVFFLPFVVAVFLGLMLSMTMLTQVLVAVTVVVAIVGMGRLAPKPVRPGVSSRPELIVALVVLGIVMHSLIWSSLTFAYPVELPDSTYAMCHTQTAAAGAVWMFLCFLSGLCAMLDAGVALLAFRDT